MLHGLFSLESSSWPAAARGRQKPRVGSGPSAGQLGGHAAAPPPGVTARLAARRIGSAPPPGVTAHPAACRFSSPV